MANKQTAVKWLYDRIIIFPKTIDDLAHNARLFKEAEQMHEEQIREAYVDGCVGEMYEVSSTYTAEQYYNATYNKKEDGTI